MKFKMSDYYIPFEIQEQIMKKLPVKSLLQFRSVSKQWKSFIDNPEFIKTYHINHPNPQHRLLLQCVLDTVGAYTSIIDDDTFPHQKFSLIAPEPLNKLRYTTLLGSVDGLLCIKGYLGSLTKEMVVIWNPSVRKCVGIPIAKFNDKVDTCTDIAFGVSPETNDPTLLKINNVQDPNRYWEVQVFTLSSRVWRTVYTGAPFKSCNSMCHYHVFIDGVIYWFHHGRFITSFDLKSDKFGEVCIPERLVRSYSLELVKVNDSLGLLEYKDNEGEMSVCGVWMRKDVDKPFTKIYTVKVEGNLLWRGVLGFRNNGEVVIEMVDDDLQGSRIEVYEPSSGRRNNSVGISGMHATFTACSYMETLLLLDESNSIIH